MVYHGGMTRTETALQYFDEGCDCGKALLHAYEPVLSLNEKTREKYRAPFSQLLGSPAECCEVVSGALEILAHAGTASAASSADLAARFKARFMTSHTSTRCKDLLGYDLGELRGSPKSIDTDAVDHVCHDLIIQACRILDELIGDKAAVTG